jgi:diguanylate cyclase (GGDEF)-like protein
MMTGPGTGNTIGRRYLTVQLIAIAVLLVIPHDSWTHVFLQVAVGALAAAFVVIGMLRQRPPGALAWCLFGVGVLLNAGGTLVEGIEKRIFAITDYPTSADLFWVALYPAFIIGMALLVRRRTARRDWAALVDTGIISTGLGLLAWVLIIRPQAFDPTLSMVGRAAVVVGPLSDIVLLAMMVRLLLGGGARTTAFRFLLGALLGLTASDLGWTVFSHLGRPPGPIAHRLLAMSFSLAYALVGAAALHPSVREAGTSAPVREERLSPWLLLGLTVASLVAPALLLIEAGAREIPDALAIALGSTLLFLLVLARMAQLLRQVEAQAKLLRDLARVDDLTGLPNRRVWTAELPIAMERARREATPMSIAMIDLDHFKRFNDTHGHPAGDQLLRSVASNWRGHLRNIDQLARYGGEEFIALLPIADAHQAVVVLERLRQVTPAGQTFSAGVATWDGAESADDLIGRADRALYQAKASGRNRSIIFGADSSAPPLSLDRARS